uniref:Condensation domain-containing protein n=1 Tax=Candidatus Kentrum sp. LFY TaxID=2126342 RepID=A0A450X7C5_9GAMM|nr:MAG: Condensation domain-containing protein [Candidatus Kentron sp. LFY]
MKHYPLSSPQLDFWFDQVLHPNVPLYNIGGYVRIAGPVNPTLFEQALNRVVAGNDALRIILHEGEEGLPTQTFAEEMAVELDFRDFSERGNGHEGDHDLAHVSALAWMQQEFERPLVGKGEAKATPSPLSQWGQFPIFTGVRLSRTGRLPGDSPSRGTIIATYTHG